MGRCVSLPVCSIGSYFWEGAWTAIAVLAYSDDRQREATIAAGRPFWTHVCRVSSGKQPRMKGWSGTGRSNGGSWSRVKLPAALDATRPSGGGQEGRTGRDNATGAVVFLLGLTRGLQRCNVAAG